MSFEEFTNLPSELQNEIISKDYLNLLSARQLSKSLRFSTEEVYYEQFCNLPITKYELIEYIKNVNNQFNMYVWDYNKQKNISLIPEHITNSAIIKFANFRYNLYHYIGKSGEFNAYIPYTYKLTGEYVLKDIPSNYIYLNSYNTDPNVKYVLGDEFVDDLLKYNFDLIIKYHIYHTRICEQIKPGYAKRKILEELTMYYDQINKSDFLSLLSLNSYMRSNAQLMGVNPGKILFDEHDIIVNDYNEIISTDISDIYPEEIITISNEINNDLYLRLRNAIICLP
jgi:hypothetical protein